VDKLVLTDEEAIRFWSKVDKSGEHWIWTGASSSPKHSKEKYGTFRLAGKMEKVHRISYAIHHGLIPYAQEVRHTCDITLCVKPEDLICGYHYQNMQDIIDRGRDKGQAKINREKTHCKRGHELSGYNLSIDVNGSRQCKKCQVIRTKKWADKKRMKEVLDMGGLVGVNNVEGVNG
jgi:hypothetical protein